MFASHTSEYQLFSLFESFLRNILSGEDAYKSYVDKVLDDAHRLAKDRKSIFALHAQYLPIVIYLSQKERDFFSELNTNQISKEEYSRVLNMIHSAEEILD